MCPPCKRRLNPRVCSFLIVEDDQIYRSRRVSIQNSSKGLSGGRRFYTFGFRTLTAFPFRLSLFRFPNTPPPPPTPSTDVPDRCASCTTRLTDTTNTVRSKWSGKNSNGLKTRRRQRRLRLKFLRLSRDPCYTHIQTVYLHNLYRIPGPHGTRSVGEGSVRRRWPGGFSGTLSSAQVCASRVVGTRPVRTSSKSIFTRPVRPAAKSGLRRTPITFRMYSERKRNATGAGILLNSNRFFSADYTTQVTDLH